MKITIITVNYNNGKTLRRTIESVLCQTYEKVEYIIIDGKSKDNSLEIISEYKDKFKKRGFEYKYISEKDTGIYNAMNKGIELSTGDIIGIIGADDWYEKDTLEKVGKEFKKDKDLKLVYGLLRIVKNGEYDRIIGEYNSYGVNQHPTVFLKRDIYKEYKYDEKYRIAADTDLLLKLKNKKIKIKFIESILTNFSIGGISSTDKLNVALEDLEIYYKNGKISKYKKNKKYFKLIFKKKINNYKNKLKIYLNKGE